MPNFPTVPAPTNGQIFVDPDGGLTYVFVSPPGVWDLQQANASSGGLTAPNSVGSPQVVDGSIQAVDLAAIPGLAAATYGNSAQVAQVQGNVQGQVTAIGNVNIQTMAGATAVAAGVQGFAPAPAAGDQAKYLRGDATYGTAVPSTVRDVLTPTAQNAVPNLSQAPAGIVTFFINDAFDCAGGVTNAGQVITVNAAALSYNVGVTDRVTAIYNV